MAANVFVSAGEISGDVVGALLTREIRHQDPNASVVALGGSRLAAAGAALEWASTHVGAVGITEALFGIASLPPVIWRVRQLLRRRRPDVAVLIGNDLFNVCLARWLRSHGIPCVAYFPPQVWVWGAVAVPIANSYDAILTSFPEEQAVYSKAARGTAVVSIGHYLADALCPVTPEIRQTARCELGLREAAEIVGLLPGSRAHEISSLVGVMLGAAGRLVDEGSSVTFIVPTADQSHTRRIEKEILAHDLTDRVLIVSDSRRAMQAADVLLVASGTASLEAALFGVPSIITYKVSPLTHALIRIFLRLGILPGSTIGLPNLVLGRKVAPELLQSNATADGLAAAVRRLMADVDKRDEMRRAFAEVSRKIAGQDPLARAAEFVLALARAPRHEDVRRCGAIACPRSMRESPQMTSGRRVVISGIGMVTPLGPSLASTIAALKRGDCAIDRRPTLFDTTPFVEALGGEVKDFDARAHFRVAEGAQARRTIRRALPSQRLRWRWRTPNGPQDDEALERLGVVVGCSGSDLQTRDLARALRGDEALQSSHDIPFFSDRILAGLNPLWLLVNLPNMSSAHVAIQLNARGPNSTIMTDWVAGSQAIGEAGEWIRAGEADAVLAGGADTALTPFVYALTSRRACLASRRPAGAAVHPG